MDAGPNRVQLQLDCCCTHRRRETNHCGDQRLGKFILIQEARSAKALVSASIQIETKSVQRPLKAACKLQILRSLACHKCHRYRAALPDIARRNQTRRFAPRKFAGGILVLTTFELYDRKQKNLLKSLGRILGQKQ
jgi:hypothetical protein